MWSGCSGARKQRWADWFSVDIVILFSSVYGLTFKTGNVQLSVTKEALKATRKRNIGTILHSLATGWEDGESLTSENEDVVAMGTVNPSVTQRVPG
ncbi:hypothetical protein F2P81_013108, partial [Scophthalmus maximus]